MPVRKMEERIRKLAANGVPMDDLVMLGRAYTDEYGVKATKMDLARYALRVINTTAVPTVGEVKATPELVEMPVMVPSSQFVSDELMKNGSAIRQAVIDVGGPLFAISLGNVIEQVGGMANFTRAVEFLESVNALPVASQPQIANGSK